MGIEQLKRRCVVPGCGLETRPPRLLCTSHWYAVPKGARAILGQCYVPGQETNKAPPNPGWCAALATCALLAVAHYDDNEEMAVLATLECVVGLLQEMGWVQEVALIPSGPPLGVEVQGEVT